MTVQSGAITAEISGALMPKGDTYFTRRGDVVYFLLLGGDKSTQKRDVKRAKEMARTLPKE